MLHAESGRCVLRLSGLHAPVAVLAGAQLVAWGTLYYGIAFLAPAIGAETGWSPAGIFGAYSAGLLVAALLAAPVGHLLARRGGRKVMTAGSLLAAIAFALMAVSNGLWLFCAAWLVAGAAMAMSLYEAAFSTLREQVGRDFRRGIGLITLVGGLASTLFWPLTHALVAELGWRSTTLVFACLNLGMGWCLFLWLPAHTEPNRPPTHAPPPRPAPGRIVLPLAFAFACAALATSAVSAHIAVLLGGLPASISLTAMAMIGPMQVAGRLLEWRLAQRVPVRATGRLAFLGLAAGLALLAWSTTAKVADAWPVFAFAILYGAANGVLTVVRGGAPAEWLPDAGYAATLGALSAPALIARSLAPLATASILAAWGGTTTLWLLTLAALAGLAAFSVAAARARIPAN